MSGINKLSDVVRMIAAISDISDLIERLEKPNPSKAASSAAIRIYNWYKWTNLQAGEYEMKKNIVLTTLREWLTTEKKSNMKFERSLWHVSGDVAPEISRKLSMKLVSIIGNRIDFLMTDVEDLIADWSFDMTWGSPYLYLRPVEGERENLLKKIESYIGGNIDSSIIVYDNNNN